MLGGFYHAAAAGSASGAPEMRLFSGNFDADGAS
jgi:hypothetical protein